MKIDELTFGNDIDNLITAHSLEHEQCSESFMQRDISGSVEESGLQCGHLLRGHLNRHFSFLFFFLLQDYRLWAVCGMERQNEMVQISRC